MHSQHLRVESTSTYHMRKVRIQGIQLIKNHQVVKAGLYQNKNKLGTYLCKILSKFRPLPEHNIIEPTIRQDSSAFITHYTISGHVRP